MTRACPITLRHLQSAIGAGVVATLASGTMAQQAIRFMDDHGSEIPFKLLERPAAKATEPEPPAQLDPMTIAELSELRAAGVDPSWIVRRFEIPGFDPTMRRFTQNDHPLAVESWATHYTDGRGFALNDSLRFSVGRTTALRDGDIAGSQGALGDNSGTDHLASVTQSEGEYDIYDFSLEWDAMSAGPLTLSLLSGFKAIEANIGKRVSTGEGMEIDSEHRVTAMPMVGSGLRWKISDDLSFSGAALTLPIDSGDTLIDFNASTDLRISRNVAFVAGYRIIRSTFDVGDISTELHQEGLFARLEIKF